jgi:hypothetical protein
VVLRRLIVIIGSFLSVTLAFGAGVASDEFPTGQETPEGVAADLARAFINRDYVLFEKICVPLYGGKEVREGYAQFCAGIKKSMREEAKKKEPSPGGPKMIVKVFAARRFSKNGPTSYGCTVLGFEDVQFVDVLVFLVSGQGSLNRTLVVKKGGKWFVHPLPSISPLLCAGLNEEEESVTDWSDKKSEAQSTQTPPPVVKPSSVEPARRP